MISKDYPTKEELEKVFFVDTNGTLMRKFKSGKIKVAGTVNGGGYVTVGYNNRQLYAHLISFILDRGHPPVGIIDHKDTNTQNNAPDNLRDSTHSQNSCNKASYGSSGFRGVYKNGTFWQVKIQVAGTKYQKCGFATPEEANEHAIEMRKKLHGEYARHD